MPASQEQLIIITPTYAWKKRTPYFKRLIRILQKTGNLFWMIIEDEKTPDASLEEHLKKSGLNYLYHAFGPTRDYGTSQRNYALTFIRDQGINGVVYVADDDNDYKPALFPLLQKTIRVSVFPVGHLGARGIEQPLLENGKIVGWDAGWKERTYPLDWAGFAFHSRVLRTIKDPILKGVNYLQAVQEGVVPAGLSDQERIHWLRSHKDGESEFLEKIVNSKEEFEILTRKCLVWHNQPLHEPIFFTALKNRLKRKLHRWHK